MDENSKISETAQRKIYLTYIDGTGFVFNRKDYVTLRRKYRIIGARREAGYARFTIPVRLTPLETRLLVERGIAVLVSKKDRFLGEFSVAEQENVKDRLTQHLKKRIRVNIAEKTADRELSVPRKHLGKRKHFSATITAPLPSIEEINKKITENVHNTERSFVLEARIVSVKDINSFQYRVFRDLWMRGYYITCGDVYGGDFVIYNGDPERYHSSHIINLIADGKLHYYEMRTMSRMATAVRKNSVVAYLIQGDENQATELKYYTFKWNRQFYNSLKEDNIESSTENEVSTENESSTEN
ncbi:tRNA-splicing endonuclease subunit SEN34-like [Teleopsis dalmanni]|uniref:tRNA-splicing endonuclease subunit SEN34-like n=1 Tax=Teleopsis dalmanni TaxID=139649 RepID=UPI0018CEF3DD|nr:tRNA-splicing endonuclease subunit SEN34-like [Teleopsis dalmanni]